VSDKSLLLLVAVSIGALAITAQTPSITISVSPTNANLSAGQQQSFSALLNGTTNTAVAWSVSPGFQSITADGIYTAPSSLSDAPIVTVTATSLADPDKTASADIRFYDSSAGFPATGSGSAYPIQGTFLNFYRNLTPELWQQEFDYMKAVDINTIVVLSLGHLRSDSNDQLGYSLAPDGLLYPSNYLPAPLRPADDLLEQVLSLADQQGMKVYLGSLQTETDWSDGTEFAALRSYNQRVAAEVVERYGHHASLAGWYFTQELWMNWVKYSSINCNAATYSGTTLMSDWVADMKAIDPTKLTTAAIVVKETGMGAMPGLTPNELEQWTTSFLQATKLDILMPQDGIGAGAGAPSLIDLGDYFAALAAGTQAAGTNTTLWSTIETFTAVDGSSGAQYPPVADVSRLQQQVSAVRPYVTGYVSYIFGDDMSPQATYYPVEASELARRYKYIFEPQVAPDYDVIPLQNYQYSALPSSSYPDSGTTPKLSDRTGGGSYGYDLASWVGFESPSGFSTLQVTGDLGSIRTIAEARALTLSWTPSAIYHPARVDIETSQDGSNWTAFGSTNSFAPDTQNFSVMWGNVTGSAPARYIRWTFTYQGWLFLAELEAIGPT
jgi:hypothetical protein